MRKKLFLVSLLICMTFALSGCGNAIPDLSDDQMTLVTTYAATLLLEYDSHYKSKLLNDEELAKEEEIQKQIEIDAQKLAEKEAAKKEREQNKDSEDSKKGSSSKTEEISNLDLASILELDGFTISCTGVTYSNQYPDNSSDMVFMVNASNGCKLAVLHLNITNNSGSDQTINLLEKNPKFKMAINGGEYHQAMQMTVLDDEFSAYSGTIGAGQTVSTVLLVDMLEDQCVDASSVTLSVKYNGNTMKTSIY